MVNYSAVNLDRTFSALTDATRRSILARLEAEGPITVSDIAEPLIIKLPAVLKHLGVLEDARLIRRTKVGRVVTIKIEPEVKLDNQQIDRLTSGVTVDVSAAAEEPSVSYPLLYHLNHD